MARGKSSAEQTGPSPALRSQFIDALMRASPRFMKDLRRCAKKIADSGIALSEFQRRWRLKSDRDRGHWLSYELERLAVAIAVDPLYMNQRPSLHRNRVLHQRLRQDFILKYEQTQRKLYRGALAVRLRRVQALKRRKPDDRRVRKLVWRVRRWLNSRQFRNAVRRLKKPLALDPADHRALGDLLLAPFPLRVLHDSWEFPRLVDVRKLFAPIEAIPLWEDAEAFERRARKHWHARLRTAESLGVVRAASKTSADRFDWFVRYQVNEESCALIAMNSPFSEIPDAQAQPTRIAKGVKATAKALGLSLRPGIRGRPSSSMRRGR